jgi:hypothetical protein
MGYANANPIPTNDQNPGRVVVTVSLLPPLSFLRDSRTNLLLQICSRAFTSPNISLWPTKFSDTGDFHAMKIQALAAMVSHTIVHELAHAVSFTYIQDYAYGWDAVIRTPASTAILNANSYALLGDWAVLADMGYTIARVNERGLSRNEKAVREENAVLGFIEDYRRTTSRMLRRTVFLA